MLKTLDNYNTFCGRGINGICIESSSLIYMYYMTVFFVKILLISLGQTLKKSWNASLACGYWWNVNMNFLLCSKSFTGLPYVCMYVCMVLMTHWWNLSGQCRWCTAARRRWRWTHPLMSSEQWWCHGRRCTVPLLWKGGWELHVDETTTWLIMTLKLRYGHNHWAKLRNKVKYIFINKTESFGSDELTQITAYGICLDQLVASIHFETHNCSSCSVEHNVTVL